MIYLSNEPYPQEISVPRSFGVIVPHRNEYLSTADIATDLTTDSDTKVLAASQGVVLKEMVDAKADKSNTYTKAQVNSALALKAEKSNTYTKAQVDEALAEKADATGIPTKTSDLINDSGFVTGQEVSQTYETKSDATAKETALQNAINRKQDILTFDNVPTNGSSNPVKSDGIYDALATKQPNISDLQTIRSGAAAGATAVQPAALATGLATKQDILESGVNIKTINNQSLLGSGNIDIQGGGGEPEAVKFIPQTLTEVQKAQARTNIEAASNEQVSQLGQKVTDFAQVVTATKTVIPNLEEGKTIYYRFSCADHNIGCIGFFDANNAQIGSWIGNTSGANLAQDYEGAISVPSGASYLKAFTASPGFTIDALYYTDSVIDTIHKGLDEKLDIGVGKNIFDNVLIPGVILSTGKTSTTVTDFSYTKNFLPVLPNTQYSATKANGGAVAISANAIVLFYDKNKTLLGTSSLNGVTTFTTPADTAFIRLNIYDAYNNEIQIEVGNARTEYEPYSAISKYLTGLPNASVGINTIKDSAKDAEPIRTSVKLPLSGGIVTYGERNYVPFGCKNIYDNVLEPGFFNPNGTVSSSTVVSHTVNYLPVKPETEYIATKADGAGIAAGVTQMVFYNKAKAVISAIALGGVTTFTTPSGCYYIRTSVYNSYNNKVQIELGNTRTTYEPYNPIYKYLRPYEVAQTKSLLGASRVSASADTLEANTPLELTDFPKFSHARTGITAIAYFTNFTDMSVGNNREGGVAVKVDNTNVYFLVNPNSGTENAWETFAHGLTISTFLKVEIYVTKFGTVKVILFTNGGIKVINSSVNYSFNYVLMVKSSAVLEQVTISAVCGAFRCPVWALGDSYFGESVARVGYQMRELGFKDLYWSFLSGGHGYNLEPDFELALNFGTPKFVVWAIGQNDADSDTTISATWLQHTEKLLALCVEKGITPILCTIPNVTGSGALRNHSFKNAWVKASGYRYIDTEAAVGAQADGTWYPGMLSSDNIHPSVLGAQAIATQWLIDFPEVMEYGLLDEELPTE